MNDDCKEFETRLDDKVGWNRFTWIIGVLVSVLIVVVSFINARISKNREDIIDLRSIAPVLEANIENIKEDVKEIQKDLKILIINQK